jgi:hypothetical protein
VGDLREAYAAATAQALETTRALDDTHYALLERFGLLAGQVGALREVVRGEGELRAGFDADVAELERETVAQMDGLEAFGARGAERVGELEKRLAGARKRAEGLGARLERAAKRVEEREKVELAWEAKVARRLRVLWGVCVAVLAVLLAGGVFTWFRQGEVGEGVVVGNWTDPEPIVMSPPPLQREEREEDPRLRLFDEL